MAVITLDDCDSDAQGRLEEAMLQIDTLQAELERSLQESEALEVNCSELKKTVQRLVQQQNTQRVSP